MGMIAGFVRHDGAPAEAAQLDGMLDRLAATYRRDAVEKRIEGNVALAGQWLRGHVNNRGDSRLATDAAGRILAGDVRLDNREELADALGIARADLPELSDSALVLAAWERWKTHCPEQLLGDFAFALWDAPERRLFCARDQVGIRPFYYTRTQGCFAFASAVKGVLALPEVPDRLDEIALADYLVLFDGDLERTFHEDIKRLPPAHWLMVDEGRLRMERYFAFDRHYELKLGSDAEYTEALRAEIRRAVECRLGRTGTAVMLSGGLDSSTVACMAAPALAKRGERLTAVSSVLPDDYVGPAEDERKYIHVVADALDNLDLYEVGAPGLGPLSGLDKAIDIEELPIRDGFHYKSRAVYEAAVAQGADTLLTGVAGDNAVSTTAPGYLAELARKGYWLKLAHELRARKATQNVSSLRLLRSRVLTPMLPELLYDRLIRRRHLRPYHMFRQTAIAEKFAARMGVAGRMWAAREGLPRLYPSVRANSINALESGMLVNGLESLAHWGEALGFTPNHPLLDRKLLSLAVSLPFDQHARNGWTRLALRRAATGVVPDLILQRVDKGPFSPDHVKRIVASRELIRVQVEALETMPRLRMYLDANKLRDAFEPSIMAKKHLAHNESRQAFDAQLLLSRALSVLAYLPKRGVS
jgi:asparagine synthase (glutamine-hydrolysing)